MCKGICGGDRGFDSPRARCGAFDFGHRNAMCYTGQIPYSFLCMVEGAGEAFDFESPHALTHVRVQELHEACMVLVLLTPLQGTVKVV